MRILGVLVGAAVLASVVVFAVMAQGPDAFLASRDHRAVQYGTTPVNDPVSQLNRKLSEGSVRLLFDGATGYLRPILSALNIPIASQVLVFSQTSSQAPLISPRNPRAIYFSDNAAVGWVRGGDILEVAAHDPQQGVVFYSIDQTSMDKPQLKRDDTCLLCHLTWDTLAVPGWFTVSTFPMIDRPNAYASGFVADHRSPLPQRWGGWYVTGRTGSLLHTGNIPVLQTGTLKEKPTGADLNLKSVEGRFDTNGFLSLQSDVVALMVLEHQAHMINLLTRTGWEVRVAEYERPTPIARIRDAAVSFVDYLLFVDEAPFSESIQGSSTFADEFSARGPRDSKGRSLRQFDLERRLMRYPCSYMIYSDAFEALPRAAKDAIYARMWQILSGQERQAPYTRLSVADRQAIVEILRETKKDLPGYFQPVTQ
jgi:hypothetical protein